MMESKQKVLFVGAFPPRNRQIYGGMVTACRSLMGSSLPNKINFDLIDTTQISNPAPNFFTRLVLAIKRSLKYLYRFESGKPDAVWLFSAPGASLIEKGAMGIYSKIRGVPVVMFPRGGEVLESTRRSFVNLLITKIAFMGVRKVVCQGPAWQKFSVEKLKFSKEDSPIVENWTAENELLSIGAARVFNKSSEILNLLFVGWVEKEKGIFELLEVFSRLSNDFKISLEIVGSGNSVPNARKFLEGCNLLDRVKFSGWLEGEPLNNAYARADIFVLPSWAEGFPNAIIEAMATKLAVVATDVGTISDNLTNGEALIVPPKNLEALQKSISELLTNQYLREEVAEKGYLKAKKNWNVERAVSQLVELSKFK